MSEAATAAAEPKPSLGRIFWVFLVMGATSLGGGVVGYLRSGLVVRERWVDDVTFVELLSISQTLPGLNATNMSILVIACGAAGGPCSPRSACACRAPS